jgi:Mannosyltransferase (PIG-V)
MIEPRRPADRRGWPALESRTPTWRRLPPWARAADFVSLALAAMGVTVAASGGFRSHLGSWHFALTSPSRPLGLALLIAVVRHLIVREQPIHAHLLSRGREWARSVALRTAVTAMVGTRPAVFFVGLLAVLMFGYAGGAAPWRDYDNELFNLQLRWDAGWYLGIAEHDYEFVPQADPALQQNIVFFPAYPILTRALALLLGNHKGMYVASATVVSLVAFLFALTYLHAFARDELGEDEATAAVWLLAAYPFALFYGAVYTESLYLLGALGAFFHFRRGEFVRAGAWGFMIGLTRPNGALMCAPLGLLAISTWLPAGLAGGRQEPRFGRQTWPSARALAAAAMCGVGTLAYSLFIWGLTGDPLTWVTGHAAWGRHYQSLTNLFTDRLHFIGREGLYGYVARLPYDALNALGALFVLVAVWPVWRRLGIAFAVFILINILPPLATGGLLSAGRFSAVLFPAFVWLAGIVPARHRAAWLVGFAVLQAFNAALFYTWRPLY